VSPGKNRLDNEIAKHAVTAVRRTPVFAKTGRSRLIIRNETNNPSRKDYHMKWIKKALKTWLPVLALFTGLAIAGCEGTDSREMVDDTVRELSGQKNVERMKQMKENIAEINKKQADRLKNLP
jgi:hypothetical protein